jgi:hypothetical protein
MSTEDRRPHSDDRPTSLLHPDARALHGSGPSGPGGQRALAICRCEGQDRPHSIELGQQFGPAISRSRQIPCLDGVLQRPGGTVSPSGTTTVSGQRPQNEDHAPGRRGLEGTCPSGILPRGRREEAATALRGSWTSSPAVGHEPSSRPDALVLRSYPGHPEGGTRGWIGCRLARLGV